MEVHTSGKQREMKGKQRGTERDMTGTEMKTSAGGMTGKQSAMKPIGTTGDVGK